MAERNWDIELTNDAEKIQKNLASGRQLCMLLNKDLPKRLLFKLIEQFNILAVPLAGEDRFAVVCGAYKAEGAFQKNPEQEQKAFGRQVNEQIFDDLIQINGEPYFPFCEGVDTKVVDKLRATFDVQEIFTDQRTYTVVLGYYYDEKALPAQEARVVAQLPPVFHKTPPNLN